MGKESMEEKASCSSSATTATTTTAPIPPQDDFSLFLHHFLHRSSSSSSSSLAQTQGDPHQQLHSLFLSPPDIQRPPARLLPSGEGISAVESSAGGGGQYLLSAGGPHAPSSSVGASENETDDYDCESEV